MLRAALLLLALAGSPGWAADETLPYPAGVVVRDGKAGGYFADARGMTLYTLNQRLAGARSGAFSKFCTGPCAESWKPLAGGDSAPVSGDWKVADGIGGPQWFYKNNPVFTHVADKRPGDVSGDKIDDLWSVIAYVPPPPKLVAPASVSARFRDGAYVMTDADGQLLFTAAGRGDCGKGCAGWRPLGAGMASRPLGDWTVVLAAGHPQWAYKGRPVFVGDMKAENLPAGGRLLKA